MWVALFLCIIVVYFFGTIFKDIKEMGPLAYIVIAAIAAVGIIGLVLIYTSKRNKYNEYMDNNEQLEKISKEQEKTKNEREKLEIITRRQKEDYEAQKLELERLSQQQNDEIEKLKRQRDELTKEISELTKRAEIANSELTISETTVFEDEEITSEEFKDKLAVLRLEYKDFIKTENAVNINSIIYIGEKKKRLNDNVRQILRCFNSEAAYIISSVNVVNIEKMRGSLSKSFETINNIFSTDGLTLNKQLLEMRLKELNLVYSYQKKKEQEQEEQKAIRAQMLEEEKVRREIEREKAKVAKEESQFKNEVDKLMKYLSKANDDIQKQLYIDKIKELEEKIKLLEKDKENILQREQNTRAGFVYIISNIGSFGENIYKIGMTRRLEPMDRVKELGDASVPFEFDVHAMIFSDDAPALETILHNTFKENQVNLVNPRKEFYNVSLEEIEKVVKENYNATVIFTHIAEAAQYRESVRIRQVKQC